jgi:cobalt/nickel transport system ATP-binding protein
LRATSESSPPPLNAAIRVEGLDYTYAGGRRVLSQVQWSLAEGERLAIVGPSGAGKSTLLLHLNGLLPDPLPRTPPRSGVTILGQPVIASTVQTIRKQVGFVFQDPDDQLFGVTVFEDVAFGPQQQGCSSTEVAQRVRTSLQAVGLAGIEKTHPGRLSYGERKRVCLAGVLACQPQILVLDEPSSNLDPRARRQLIGILQQLNLTVVVATHDLELVLETCQQVLVLDQGVIQAHGAPDAILSDPLVMDRHGLEVPWPLRRR